MQTIVRALAEQHRELDETLSGLTVEDWRRPSRCPGWTIGDVVLHLSQTDELALASGQGRHAEAIAGGWTAKDEGFADVDSAAAAAVERERGPDGPALHRRWRASSSAVREMLAGCDPRDQLRWVAGTLPARTLATTRLAEAWIHTGDVLAGLDVSQPATDRLWHIARLAWRMLPYAFARDGRELSGPVGLALIAPDGSSWEFGLDDEPATTIRGVAVDFCLVAARRLKPACAHLSATGPDAETALALVRTFA